MRALRLLPVILTLFTFTLAAQQSDGSPAGKPLPRLSGIVDLGSLALLWNDSGEGGASGPEPLDMASTGEGPILLFADRLLSLGVHLQMVRRTAQDLSAVPRLPQGIVPSRLLLNALSDPIVYEGETGTLLLLYRDGSEPQRFETGFPRALEAASLKRGGVVLSDGKRLVVFTRKANGLSRREIILPAAFNTGLSVDKQDRLWVYDLAARSVRVFDLNGQQLFAISPDISGGTLLFPQVFGVRADGGFFLGTAGELWCFDADGSVRWRLTQYSAGYRQALPAFYRLAVAGDRTGGDQSPSAFYLLDPLGNRIMRFVEDPGSRNEKQPAIDSTLADAFQSAESLRSRQNEILRVCLEKELYLQAAFFRRSRGDEPVVTDLTERIRAKQAGLLAGLAEQLENELRFPEAEAAYNHSLSLYRELRNLDPVDPRYPEAIRELSKQRNAVRQIRVAENLLTAAGNGSGDEGVQPQVRIVLTNTSGTAVEQVEVSARFNGYPASRWQGSLLAIPGAGSAILTIPFSGSTNDELALLNDEDLRIPCNLLVRYVHDGRNAAQSFHLPLVFPAGTLHLPE